MALGWNKVEDKFPYKDIMETVHFSVCLQNILVSLCQSFIFQTICFNLRSAFEEILHIGMGFVHTLSKLNLHFSERLWDFNSHCSFENLVAWVLSSWASSWSKKTVIILEFYIFESHQMGSNLMVINLRVKMVWKIYHQVVNQVPFLSNSLKSVDNNWLLFFLRSLFVLN